jgi:ribosomal protein S18 acetylase RimI-like enzyme
MRVYREIGPGDIPSLFAVRTSTRENAYTMSELADLGITPATVGSMIGTSHMGWLCEEDGEAAGFAMGDGLTGEMWVIAVAPGHEGKGIGSRLLSLVEGWLFSQGWEEIWLTTDRDTSLRAYGFYIAMGWRDDAIRDGLRYMRKVRDEG